MVDQLRLTKKQINAVAHLLFAGGSNGDTGDVADLLKNFYRNIPPEYYDEIAIRVGRLCERAREHAARLYLDAFGRNYNWVITHQKDD